MSETDFNHQNMLTKREWILRYATPFRALMFMAGPMIVIMIVNSLFVVVDKQLTINLAIQNIVNDLENKIYYSPNVEQGVISVEEFAKQLINVSTQYSNTILMITQALSLFTSIGTSIKFGQAMGMRDKQKMNDAMITGFIQTMILISISTVVLYFIYPFILTTQAGIDYSTRHDSIQYQMAGAYIKLFVLTFGLLAISNFFMTLLRTEGKVMIVIFNSVMGVTLNTIFGIIFMKVFDFGMQGAVLSSVVAWCFMIVSSIIFIAIQKDSLLRPNFKEYKFRWNDALWIWVFGLSPFFGNLIFAVVSFTSTILLTNAHSFDYITDDPEKIKYMLNNYLIIDRRQEPPSNGEWNFDPKQTEVISNSVRVLSSAFPWLNIIYAPVIGMNQGGTVNYAYSEGAQKRKRMIEILKIQLIISVSWMIFAEIMVLSLSKQMLAAFSGPVGKEWWLFAYLAWIPLAGFTYSLISLFQGAGRTRLALILSLARSLIFEVSFIVIGFFVIRAASDDGSKDWLFFMINGFKEIPAFILAIFIGYYYFKDLKTSGKYFDKEDDFKPISYNQSVKNVFLIRKQFYLNHYQNQIIKVQENNDLTSQKKEFKVDILNNKLIEQSYKFEQKCLDKILKIELKELKVQKDPNYNEKMIELVNNYKKQSTQLVNELFKDYLQLSDKNNLIFDKKVENINKKYDKLIKKL